MKYLFCNIGWMEKYQGQNPNDKITGGGSFVKEQGIGYEVCNFLPVDGFVYGYVQPVNDKSIDLRRIDHEATGNSIDGVLVIWTATRPTGGQTIVGWYNNATVYGEFQTFTKTPAPQQQNGITRYLIKAAAKDAVLLPIDARTLNIPRSTQTEGGIGSQSNVSYADKESNQIYVDEALNFIKNYGNPKRTEKNKNKPDQEHKIKVEEAAIRTCWEYFENIGYEVIDISKDNVGWDLEASAGKTKLRIEVKGLSGTSFSVELTPNEYKAFAEEKTDYRLAVVTHALIDPKLSICRYSAERGAWVVETEGEDDKTLNIKEKQSATISCS